MSNKPTFLYVEDDANSREVMQLLMANVLDYPLTVFEDSADFLEKFRALPQKPDVIFLDIHMLPIDGFEILKLIRAEPDGKDFTIIAMTASVMAIDVEQFKEAGFDGMVGKPIRNRIFPELLEKILNRESIWFIS
jgi:CheY-like chemotaxis protein